MKTQKTPALRPRALRAPRWTGRGLSLVELLVGVTVGLFVVAAASMLAATHIGESRRLMVETQLQQDLRAATDIISRELRRAGATQQPWALMASDETAAVANPDSTITLPATPSASNVTFQYFRRSGETGPWEFKLESGVIKSRALQNAPLQDLTDPDAMVVQNFDITPVNEAAQVLPCPKLCPGTNDTSCWPRLTVRAFNIFIKAQARSDASVVRSLQSTVRLRNDHVQFLATGPSGTAACPL